MSLNIWESQFAFNLYFGLLLIFNVYWFITYFLVIRRGFIEKTWGIPMIGVTLNLAWDISGAGFLSIFLPDSIHMNSPVFQSIINIGFVIAYSIITYQMLRYWRSDFTTLTPFEFYFFWLLAQVMSFFIIVIGSIELNDPLIFKMGFVDNFISSAFFLAMLYRRPALLGQSIYIGLSKLIGTAAVSLSSLIFPWPGTEGSPLMPFLFLAIFVLDVVYVVAVYFRAQKLDIDVWRRW
jgi:hypothetical protein